MVIYLFQEKSVEDGIKDGKRHKSDENVGKLYNSLSVDDKNRTTIGKLTVICRMYAQNYYEFFFF